MNYNELITLAYAGWGLAILLLIAVVGLVVIARPYLPVIFAFGKPTMLIIRRNGTARFIRPRYVGGAYEVQDKDTTMAFLRPPLSDLQPLRIPGGILELAYDGSPIVLPPQAAAAASHYATQHPGDEIPDLLPDPQEPILWNIGPLTTRIGSTSEILRSYVDTKLLAERQRGGLIGSGLTQYIGLAIVIVALAIVLAVVL